MWDGDAAWFRASFVATAIAAVALFAGMVPGFIDYFASVPHRGEVWKHANVHAIFGLAVVGYYLASAGARWQMLPAVGRTGAMVALSLNVLGLGAFFAQAYIGRGLVLRHRLGVEGERVREMPAAPPSEDAPPEAPR